MTRVLAGLLALVSGATGWQIEGDGDGVGGREEADQRRTSR